ncbi:hypothetical protein [Labrenzia sp. PHM005]|uniref:hypothetical protein n=1 Tax=Labrenzia sp. PHM005 TaxID=2590016 RepID=UPI00113FCBC3|nr:hypothetical protein [Labrenzia sp. PHM005]QDG79180.1 hypothetical protein FJ695_26765 [Labrenzia sp. PHM005]
MTKQVGRIKLGWIAPSLALALGTFAIPGTAAAQSPEIQTPAAAFIDALNGYDAAWSANGLAFSTVTFTNGTSTGYGQYTAKSEASFAAGEPIALYAEPVGYAFDQSSEGYSYKLSASYKLLNQSGQVLSEQDDFAAFTGTGRSKQRQLSAALTFQFDGLPAGDYQLLATFSDAIGGKSASFTLPFAVIGTN